MPYLSSKLRQQVADRAQNCCEYCQTAQKISGAQMHIEHIVPHAKGGSSTADNLCLACAWCNSFKGAKTAAPDPHTEAIVPLFNPRRDDWHEHFGWNETGMLLVGLTATGRATIIALQMNNEFIIPARRQWVSAGWHPPQR